MAKLYTHASGPVKSILVENKKWTFDSTGRITEELNFNLKDTKVIDRRQIVKYYQAGQIKSISLYRAFS